MNMVGDPDRPPLKLPGEQAYALAGIQGAIAALTALNARAADGGRGERAWVSAYQSAVLAGYRDPLVWEWTGRIGQRTGNQLVRGKSGVRQVWQAKDGYVTWSLVDNLGMVKGMIALMQADGAAGPLAEVDWENTLLADAPQEQIEAWEAVLERWFLTKTKAELAAHSAEKGLGLSKIDTPQEALDSPHWAARGFWRRLKDDGRGLDLPYPGPLFRSTAVEPEDPAPAPVRAGSRPMTTPALSDLFVLDFSKFLPGPYCTWMLADLGAEVVRVEHPRELAKQAQVFGAQGLSPADQALRRARDIFGRNKKSLLLDPGDAGLAPPAGGPGAARRRAGGGLSPGRDGQDGAGLRGHGRAQPPAGLLLGDPVRPDRPLSRQAGARSHRPVDRRRPVAHRRGPGARRASRACPWPTSCPAPTP